MERGNWYGTQKIIVWNYEKNLEVAIKVCSEFCYIYFFIFLKPISLPLK